LQSATDAAPEFVRAWVERGIASAMLGEQARAEDEFVHAMEFAGEFEPANALGLYYMYARQDKMAEGIKVLVEATSQHLGFLQGLGYLGEAYARIGKNHESLEVFTQYVRRVPNNPWAHLRRAAALSRIGKHQEALEETLAEAAKAPNSLTVTTALASRQIDAGDYPSARATIQKGLSTHPNSPALLTRLSYIELDGGNVNEAVKLARQAVTALGDGRGEPLAGYAHLNLGHALAILNQRDEAIEVLKKAMSLGVGADDVRALTRDKRLQEFLKDPRCPIKIALH
jgi:tetratricopeptide (TPR) repeat protein